MCSSFTSQYKLTGITVTDSVKPGQEQANILSGIFTTPKDSTTPRPSTSKSSDADEVCIEKVVFPTKLAENTTNKFLISIYDEDENYKEEAAVDVGSLELKVIEEIDKYKKYVVHDK